MAIGLIGILGIGVGYYLGIKQPPGRTRVIRILRYSDLGTTEPRIMNRVEAVYPESALRDRMEGTVLLSVTNRPDGSVDSVEVVKSVRKDLDDAAKQAMLQWKFYRSEGEASHSIVPFIVPFEFKLDTTTSKSSPN